MSLRALTAGVAMAASASLHCASVSAPPPEGLAEAVAAASGVKTAVAEYAMSYGAWPAPGDPSVLGSSAGYAGTWVDHIRLLADGQIEVVFKESLGSGRLQLRSRNTDPLQQPIAWLCESPDIPGIVNLAGCVFTGVAFGPEVNALAAALKTSLAEYRAANAAWPAAGDPAAIGTPTSHAGTHVARIDLAANGVLTVTLTPAAGGGHVTYVPGVTPAGAILWHCTSSDIPGIGSLMVGCGFVTTKIAR